MEELIQIVASPLIASVVSAAAALLFNWIIRRSTDGVAAQRAMQAGMRTLLRNELVEMHKEWVEEKGYITLEALEYAEETYDAYHGIRGNGSGTKLWEDIKALPIKG